MIDPDTKEDPIEYLRLLARRHAVPPGMHEKEPNRSETQPSQVAVHQVQSSRSSFRLWPVAIALCLALAVGIPGILLFLSTRAAHKPERPGLPDNLPSMAAKPGDQTASNAPASQAVGKSSAESRAVQQAMTDCDREAARNPNDLYLLIVPISPNTDAGRKMVRDGESYETFYLVSSQATLAGLADESFGIDRLPFAFAISNPGTEDRKNWGLIAGVTRLNSPAEKFGSFRVGFDVSGRGFGLVWSNPYPRQEGLCYWINVQFRPAKFEIKNEIWLR